MSSHLGLNSCVRRKVLLNAFYVHWISANGRQFAAGEISRWIPTATILGTTTGGLKRNMSTGRLSGLVPTDGLYPRGFRVSGIYCGQKKRKQADADGTLDLALIVSDVPCSAAAVFTRNVFQAAPVIVSKQALDACAGSGIRAMVANSGCANAVTGSGGICDAELMGRSVDRILGADRPATLVMSTGVIGQRLVVEKIVSGIPQAFDAAGSSHEHWMRCAKAICTTDTFPKLASTAGPSQQPYRIAGIAKGAGMIHPNMATLLSLLVTDANVTPQALDAALRYAVDRSFNSISVDGDMSTNDTMAILANGAAGGSPIHIGGAGWIDFRDSLTSLAGHLAKLVVRDGEGATKFVTVSVDNGATFEDSKKVAETIASSLLVKCALYGQDANWGRILCAIGYSGVAVDPSKVCVSFVPSDGSPALKLLVNGEPENVDERRASEIMAMGDLQIAVNLGVIDGHQAVYYTCDLSHE